MPYVTSNIEVKISLRDVSDECKIKNAIVFHFFGYVLLTHHDPTEVKNHIRVLFELKKSVNDGHLYQALAELTAGDLKSTHAKVMITYGFTILNQKKDKSMFNNIPYLQLMLGSFITIPSFWNEHKWDICHNRITLKISEL
uniref:Uncharacterized protein n=1 Tax=Rhizophagus irregularis (strain DAOM 181602 / DAOM 197198 / MUCL 43194) TaxID=747089 RepID=U9T7I0_RHIID